MKSDIEIARSIELKKIKQVAESVGIPREEVENYAVLGIGVALITSTWGTAPRVVSASLWRTPKRCCSSVMTSASLWYSTFS